jgi:hypothetical protein
MKVPIEPQTHSHLDRRGDYDTFTVHGYIGPFTHVRQNPIKDGEDMDLTMTWTTRHDLDSQYRLVGKSLSKRNFGLTNFLYVDCNAVFCDDAIDGVCLCFILFLSINLGSS